jgi:heterodisulfide reductase subunit A-like polyferredoxin
MSRIPAETGVVVIGSGVSGLVAALNVAEAGVKAIVFEKKGMLPMEMMKPSRKLSSTVTGGIIPVW